MDLFDHPGCIHFINHDNKKHLFMKQENLFTPDCIRTFTGEYINVFHIDPDTIKIEDIAHALSMQCRFGGHLPKFYSVAQHCYRCSLNVDHVYNSLAALMHDASEAYLLDIPRPIKHKLINYCEIENNLMNVIAKKFCFEWPMNDDVKDADEKMLHLEWNDLMIKDLGCLKCFAPPIAEKYFLERFNQLT